MVVRAGNWKGRVVLYGRELTELNTNIEHIKVLSWDGREEEGLRDDKLTKRGLKW